jgi:AGZA family xanthine/uracil permease-like MFS transporter
MTVGFVPTIDDIIAALSMLADVIGEGLVAISLGWAAKPTGIGFIVGLVFLLGFRSVAPVSFEVESLTILSRIAKRAWHIMIYAVIVAGIVGAILGALGAYSAIVEFIGPAIQYGMMTGVGVILAVVAVDLIKENRKIGLVSAGSAFIIFFATQSDPSALIYALAGSVVISVIVGRFVKFEPILPDPQREKITTILPWRHFGQLFRSYRTYEEVPVAGGGSTSAGGPSGGGSGQNGGAGPAGGGGGKVQRREIIKKLTRKDKILIVRAALSLLALRVGTSIAYPAIDADIAGLPPVTGSGVSIFDATNIIAGLAGFTSAIFGGAPLEPIITGTAAAPNPVISAALMMAFAAAILLLGWIGKAARYIPLQAVTGFLLVLGTLIIFPENAPLAMEADPVVGGVTAVVTAATMDPFLGLVAGLLVKGLVLATAGEIAAEEAGSMVDEGTADVIESQEEVVPPVD